MGALAWLFIGALGLWLMWSAAASSLGALAAIARNKKLRADLGAHLVPACLSALLGLGISGACLAIQLLGLAFWAGTKA